MGTLVTRVTGTCSLAFGTPPADAEVGAVITGTPYEPSGPDVTVEVVDGAGELLTDATVEVTMSLAPGSGLGSLSGTLSHVTSGGIATFGDLTIGARGLYSLQASSPGLASAFSEIFRIDPPGVDCLEDVPCEDTVTTGRSSLNLLGVPNADLDAGRLFLSFGAGLVIDCAGYDELTADTAVFDVTGDRAKVTTMTIDKRVMAQVPNNGASFLQVCFASPDDDFVTRSGAPVLDSQDVRLGRRRRGRSGLQGAVGGLRPGGASVRVEAPEDGRGRRRHPGAAAGRRSCHAALSGGTGKRHDAELREQRVAPAESAGAARQRGTRHARRARAA